MKRVVAVLVGSLLLMVGWWLAIRADLPAQVATHWGTGATPDGFTDRADTWQVLLVPVIATIAMSPMLLLARRLPNGTQWLAALPVGMTWGIGTIMMGSLSLQRGLETSTQMGFPGWLVPVGLVLGAGATALTARLFPRTDDVHTTDPAPSDAVRVDLPADARVLWHGRTAEASVLRWMAVVLVVVGVVVSWLASWWLLVVFVPLPVVLVASTSFEVTIGPTGVHVAGAVIGWPRVDVPLSTITGADTTTTSFGDFGGWGVRMSPNLSNIGVITRNGPALRLARTDGAAVVVTIDAPTEPAGVVNALLDRRAAGDTATAYEVDDAAHN